MKPNHSPASRGSALISALVFIAVGVITLGSTLLWAINHGRLAARKNELIRTQYVAEAGAERVFAAIRDHLNSTAQAPNSSVLNTIATNSVPTTNDHPAFVHYRFVTTNGTVNRIEVWATASSAIQPISSGTYAGLNALIRPYRLVSRAESFGRGMNLIAGIRRDIQIEHIPVFQFAIFYDIDMEIENGPPMTINGRVHSNANAYFAPSSSLTFQGDVTVVRSAYNNPMPGDTHQTSWVAPNFSAPITQGVSPLRMPIESANPHDIIELPPTSGSDPIAGERMFNKAGLRIRVTNSGVSVTDANGNAVSLPSGIVTTNKTLFNYRENKTVAITEINIGQMLSANKMPANGVLYVADTRTAPQQTAVRLVNGATLPVSGLTVASQNPVYIQGNYNTAVNAPAAIFGDSINILSGSWNDAHSSLPLSSRNASDTTVNAAFFTGIVPTSGSNYSGGVENLPRFLENWTGRTFTYNGSMVVMFPSETATGRWVYGGNYYTAPNRNWAFDVQFLDSTRLPPGTPSVRTLRRATWIPTS